MARQRNNPPAEPTAPATPTALAVRNREIRRVRVGDIVDNPKNYRTHDDLQRSSFRATVGEIGWYGYPDVFEHPDFPGRVMLIDGELRSHHLAEHYGADAFIDVNLTDFSPTEADKALATKDPLAGMAGVEKTILAGLLNELEAGSAEFEALIATLAEREQIDLDRVLGDAGGDGSGGSGDGDATPRVEPAALRDRFIVPPFTTLDARQGYWRERRAAWMALGIASDLGRSVVTAEFGEAPPAPDRAELVRRIEAGEVTWEWLSGHLGGTPGNIQMAIPGYYDRTAAGETRAEILADWILTRPDAIRAVTPTASRVQLDLATVDRAGLIAMLDDGRLRWDTVAGALGAVPSGPTAGIMDYYVQLRSGKTQNEIIADWILNQRTRTYNINDWAAENTSTRIAGGGVSIFDPVLCELAYRWFCPPGGAILDPFAGGSVRGIVAGALGFAYTGIDLRPEQNAANERQWEEIAPALGPGAVRPTWLTGNSLDMDEILPAEYRADFVFSCPPYYDLEVYSDDPADLSNMTWDEFLTSYRRIVDRAVNRLRDNRFCGFVVGDLRDPSGNYRNFTGETVRAFVDAGANLYNEAIFITPASTLPLRAANQFVASRKLGKAHQNFYVFCQGDGRATTNGLGAVEIAAEFLETSEPGSGTAGDVAETEPGETTRAAVPRRWAVSAAWCIRRHDCTMEGIRTRCHGRCCSLPTTDRWPPSTTPNGCAHLTPDGCRFDPIDRPVTCLLSPLRLNKSGMLIFHHRRTMPTSICLDAHGNGPPVIEALRGQLVALFGEHQYERVRADVMAGRNSYFDVPDDVYDYYLAETDWERRNVPPPGRREFAGIPAPDPGPVNLVTLDVPAAAAEPEPPAPARRERSYHRATGVNPNVPPAPKPATRRGRPRKK